MGTGVSKQLVRIGGKPIMLFSIDTLFAHPEIERIVLTYPQGDEESITSVLHDYHLERVEMVEGGSTRQESVRKALELITTPRMLLHESARPLITRELIDRVIAVDAPAVVPTYAIPFSVAVGGDVMEAEIDRSTLRDIQLPQAFDTEILRAAHQRALERDETATEDGMLVFRDGHEVRFVEGLPRNLKVTYPVDLVIAENLIFER